MGQKTHPIGFRVGIIRGWESNWFENKSYAPKLMEDHKLRLYIRKRLQNAGVSAIKIDRTSKNIILTIHTSRPGVVIGKSGKEIAQLEEELKKITQKEVKVQISEIKRPELDAYLVAENIAKQIEGRISFRRAMKTAITAAMRMGAEGIRVMCSGRLGGAEMARTEQYKEGRIPLHTIRADIDYAQATAQTIYGSIGVKVWICRGEILGKRSSE
ncbi:Ribosomal protein S3 [Melioribacter roseus P3M-2]|uniref:Small ribosomal subunit protein uS3 n=1 Tax=Melioribacter roseus (strain DSM 23840 / JCM 17771 / VKM B-2668 / P3M-2) TaxID=1191523 RepID=I6ZN95_MELRP|nr:30S ribosomal protein S3 [Melioribacter roseus]AFN73454.1 Ribosomal protein S3 [Melioribacter roseus P3M-2]